MARRAAGGDGAAFVRLYDRYSARVFETSLATTGSIEAAAAATQIGFLRLLRRPPAMDAPPSDVELRLEAFGVDATPVDDVWAPLSGGGAVGWLRSETVAKAAARFDADWSAHLARPPAGARTTTEVAVAWRRDHSAPRGPREGVVAARPLDTARPRRRRFVPGLARVRAAAAAVLGASALAVAVTLTASGVGEAESPAAPAPPSEPTAHARGELAGAARAAERRPARAPRNAGRNCASKRSQAPC